MYCLEFRTLIKYNSENNRVHKIEGSNAYKSNPMVPYTIVHTTRVITYIT